MEVTNLAEAITGDHFKYFYNIMRSQPERVWRFAAGESLGLPAPQAMGTASCIACYFSSSIWEWLMGLLEGPES